MQFGVFSLLQEAEGEYANYLEKQLRNYFKAADSMQYYGVAKLTKEITVAIIKAIRFSYNASYDKAIKTINNTLGKLQKSGVELFTTLGELESRMSSENSYKMSANVFFKGRIMETCREVKKKDLLHIPFNKRYKVRNQRYSVSGCPFIYLGKSSYIDWLELGKPNFNTLYLSGFEVKAEVKLLNMCYTSTDCIQVVSPRREDLLAYPLIYASSFKVPYERKDEPFVPEYVIPQILMQCALKNNARGVCYYSTKVTLNKQSKPLAMCLALLARNNAHRKYCNQGLLFQCITEPIAFQEVQLLPKDEVNRGILDSNCSQLVTLANKMIDYHRTNFFMVDQWIITNEMVKVKQGEDS